MTSFIPIPDPSNADVLQGQSDWRTALALLLDHWVNAGRCFSSGEVAACLREHRPDLRFSVLSIGESVRDQFYSGTLPEYADDGNGSGPIAATMVPRITEGLYPDRTPAGVEVFVYGPGEDACHAHDFEVYIPLPGQGQADAPDPEMAQTDKAAADATGQTLSAVAILGAKVASLDIRAKVHNDGRLCIPRSAFELAVHLGNAPMRGGDPVWVKVTSDAATVLTSDPGDDSFEEYGLATTRGRILFPSSDPANPFTVGDTYPVTVEKGALSVDLS